VPDRMCECPSRQRASTAGVWLPERVRACVGRAGARCRCGARRARGCPAAVGLSERVCDCRRQQRAAATTTPKIAPGAPYTPRPRVRLPWETTGSHPLNPDPRPVTTLRPNHQVTLRLPEHPTTCPQPARTIDADQVCHDIGLPRRDQSSCPDWEPCAEAGDFQVNREKFGSKSCRASHKVIV